MKKILILCLIIVLTFTMTACGKEAKYEPYADWSSEYTEGKMLSENKIHEFERDFRMGYPSGFSFRKFCEENEIVVDHFGDDITFVEGKKLANGDYVLITQNRTINYFPIAIRLRVIDKENVETIDVVVAHAIVDGIED